MAGNTETTPDAEARKWFTIAIVGAFLYVATVFAFIITRDVEADTASQDSTQLSSPQQEVPKHGQPD